jgi:hypothetical protein
MRCVCAAACGEALAAVAPYVTWLAELDATLAVGLLEAGARELAAGNTGHQQQQQAEACLVAIGGHIEGAKWPSWVDGLVTPARLWSFVAEATRLCGDQLARWHAGIKEQESTGACRCVAPKILRSCLASAHLNLDSALGNAPSHKCCGMLPSHRW